MLSFHVSALTLSSIIISTNAQITAPGCCFGFLSSSAIPLLSFVLLDLLYYPARSVDFWLYNNWTGFVDVWEGIMGIVHERYNVKLFDLMFSVSFFQAIGSVSGQIRSTSATATNLLGLAAPSSAKLGALENLYRENLKLSEEEQKILNDEPADVIKNIGILTALRTASESEPPRNPAKSNPRNQKRQKIEKIETMDGAVDSPGPSPIATSAAASRLKANTVRSVSVPSTKEIKETPVKIEEGAEGSKGPSAERAGKFFVGAEVAYKQAKMKEDGSQWIQCNIINITDIGNKKR